MKHSVNIYITPIGTIVNVPPKYARMKCIKPNGQPDMRTKDGRAYAEWAKRQDKASKEAWARGDDYINMEAVA